MSPADPEARAVRALSGARGGYAVALRLAVMTLAWLAVAGYLALHARIGPNHVDGGLLLGYIQTIADGGRPYFDFVDVYGLASWPLPALFYVAAGQKVWGLRLWLLVIKLVALGLSARLLRGLSGGWPAAAAVILLALLLGLPWQLLQTTYAFLPALALELLVLYCLLSPGASDGDWAPSMRRLVVAGVLIGLTLCVKLNSGALLWAGSLFAVFYGPTPGRASRRQQAAEARVGPGLRRLLRAAQLAGLLAYAVTFHLFIRRYYDWLYALYLSAPLALLLVWTGRHLPSPAAMPSRVGRWAVVAATAPLTALLLLGAYLGSALPDYLRDSAAIVSHLSYVSPVPPLGRQGQYVGFNEFYWPQLPWLITLVFACWWWRCGDPRSRVPAWFAVYVCNLFVMYSRTDESHLHQAMLLGVPLLALMGAELSAGSKTRRWTVGALGAAFLCVACLTLGARPDPRLWDPASGSWSTPRLSGIRYQQRDNPHVKPFAPNVDPWLWDARVDQAGAHLRRLVGDGAEVLVLARDELLSFISHTTPGGRRFRYLFYLVKNEHFDREDFLAVAPKGLLDRLVRAPPAAIVTSFGDRRMLHTFPELGPLLAQRYTVDRTIGHITIHRRRDLQPVEP